MRSTNWKTVAEMIGVSAIVISLVFVGVQLQQDRDLAQISTFGSVAESAHALSELVQSHSDVWVRGLDGESLSDTESAVFMSMIRAVEFRYMILIVRWTARDNDGFDPENHARVFAYYAYLHPGLRRVLENEITTNHLRSAAFGQPAGGAPLYQFALLYLKHLDDAPPEIPINKTYIIW